MVVAGTDAAAVVLPHLASRLIAPRAQRADVAAQDSGPGGWPTLMCQVLTTRARDQGSRPPSLLAETPTRTSSHRSPAGLLRRPGTGDQKIRLLHQGRARLPWRQQAAQTRHVRLRPSPPYNSDPVSRAYYQRKPGQGKAPWAKPSSPWPTAASRPCTP